MASAATEGQVLGHCRLLEKIGSGGMGVVFRARDEHLERDVAVKVLPSLSSSEGSLDSRARRALRQEALTLSRLNHPNIAQVHDFDSDAGTDYIVMEYVPGESLAKKLRDGPVERDAVVPIAEQTLAGMAAAHAQGIIHLDLKPANLMITPSGQVKVLDFGLAQIRRARNPNPQTASTESYGREISGTLLYMSPEQLLGDELDGRSDIWSLGVVLYELTIGRLPFLGKTVAETVDSILHAEPAEMKTDAQPNQLWPVIERCLAKSPAERYQNAEEVLADLRRVNGLSPPSGKLSFRARSRRSGLALLAAAALAALGMLVATFVSRRSGPGTAATPSSVAVLPLASLSADAGQEYFADGMTDAIINELAQASSLKVISRTSVMHYKNTKKTVEEIARELNVDGVIEGSVLREGNRVRINAQLIDARTGKQLWADSFERDERNVLALQSEIAHAIMRQLRVRLGETDSGVKRASVDPEAYDALLKARFYTYRITPADNAKAEQYAREAIGRQPDLGEAYHILAEILWYQAMTLGNPTAEESRNLLQESLKAAEKAIALGANAHATRALLLFDTTGNLAAAEQEYKRAIELQPNLSPVHGHYGVFLSLVGRCEEARGELLRAVELDPTGEFAISIAGEFLMYCRDLPSAEHYLTAAMDIDPSYQRAHRLAETAALLQHKTPQLLALVDNSQRSDEEKTEIHQALARGGEAGYKNLLLQRTLRDPTLSRRAINIASAYAWAGDRRRTLEFLRKACEENDPRARMIRAYPQYWFMDGDPEFNELLRKLGLPETTK